MADHQSDQEALAAFEAWFEHEFMACLDGPGEWDEERNCYVAYQVHMAWKGYQAAWNRRQPARAEVALKAILDVVEAHPLHTGCDYSQKELDDLGGDAATINLIAQTARNALKESK